MVVARTTSVPGCLLPPRAKRVGKGAGATRLLAEAETEGEAVSESRVTELLRASSCAAPNLRVRPSSALVMRA